ncbi:uncharacterized protein [Rutidosis leptorrhynchoides]|uniref:uncharacterized protein isoform X2 n=1 Tax=Rutidosis leptorrhynchoides TaxID=125765 RepID=UPI003A99152F
MQSSNELNWRRFSFDEIKLATDEFSDRNFISEDKYGKIYRGNFLINNYDYVDSVKRFHNKSKMTLQKEVGWWLSFHHHRNIISLMGYCDEEDERILVYEFIPYGSLYDLLRPDKYQITCNLTVEQRLEICIGTANGLSYLHFGTHDSIIHGDVNTHNIVLDGNFVAKLLPPKSTSCLRGKEGHSAPEFYDPNYVPSPKTDVYAFGVVLLELLCEMPDWKTLNVLALPSIINGELPEVISEYVMVNISIECSRACANLVKACLDYDPDKRPSMNQVKDKLLLALQLQKQKSPHHRILLPSSKYAFFGLEDIKRATNGFAVDNLLGEGTFWKSYHGYFYKKRYKGDVFVKRISKKLIDLGSYNFNQEVQLLARCDHVNIISLLGYCDEDNEKIIVYKFMPNGMLYDYLYNNQDNAPRLTNNQDNAPQLTIKQRLDICIGVAHGLCYLHKENIIHGNLATYKIFLDHDLVPGISGMDMALPIHSNNFSNRIVHYKHEGYPAPECYNPEYKPSQKVDVYAFGILLLEVLCEKPPWMSLVMLALEFAMKGELLMVSHNPVEISTHEKCLRACENLIRECLDVNPNKRPSMKQVVDRLELALKLRKNFQNDKAKRQQLHNPSSSSSCQSFLFSDIAKATENFSDYLGEGAFGKVYRGNIFADNYSGVVAVKRMTMKPEKGIPAFNKEIQLVSACDHINIISLVGFCNEESEKILLYEFMPNGSLYDYLHKDKDRAAQLTIEQRLEICIGVAKGLDYLHCRTDYVIIHSDLKSDNILLDQNLVPKISDFGLSRTRDAGPSTSKQITYHIQGTNGYLAPECHEPNYQLSRKVDVYAYGVVLLEVLCEGQAWENLVNSALKFIRRGELPYFTPDYVARHISLRCSLACQHLIMECLDTDPVKRPDMNQVVTRIEEALRLEKEYSEDHLLPFTDPKVFSSSSDRAVLYYKSKSALLPRHNRYYMDDNFVDDNLRALKLLENYGKRVDYRNILLDPLFIEQLEKIYGWRKYTLPQLFIGGKHIGGMRMIRKLIDDGTLRGMLDGVSYRDYPFLLAWNVTT